MIKLEVLQNYEGDLVFKLTEGRDELYKAMKDKGREVTIPASISIKFDIRDAIRHYCIERVKEFIPLLFGLTPDLGLEYIFVDQNGNRINFNQ